MADLLEVDPQDLSARLKEGWQLVDVREVDERAGGHIGGDHHVVMEELPQRAEEIGRDQPVVFYCRTGNRSGMAAEAFRSSGYDAYHLAGGIEAWEAAGLPVEQD